MRRDAIATHYLISHCIDGYGHRWSPRAKTRMNSTKLRQILRCTETAQALTSTGAAPGSRRTPNL